MMAAYFLVILPLPSIESVMSSTSKTIVILEPLESVRDYIRLSTLTLSSKQEIPAILGSTPAMQLMFNILLLFPFGVYLRYYFKRN